MSKNSPDAVLQISPQSEIRFKGPFTDVVVSEISLRNISENNACFKIKTTAPKQYCVRPNCGLVEPGKTAIVTVMLQPFNYNAKEKVKHKFLVLSMPAPNVPLDSIEQLWRDPPTDTVFETKLRCVFDVTPETQPASKDVNTSKVQQQNVDSTKTVHPLNVSPAKSKLDVLAKSDRTDDDPLVAEHKKLVEENSQLKQDSQRLRKVMMSSSTSNHITLSRSPESNAFSLFTVGLVAVVAIVFGLLLGKYVI